MCVCVCVSVCVSVCVFVCVCVCVCKDDETFFCCPAYTQGCFLYSIIHIEYNLIVNQNIFR